jgi:hypothetical protein
MIERIAATAGNYNRAVNKSSKAAYYNQLQGMILVLATMGVDIQLVRTEDKKIAKIISRTGCCSAECDVI